MRRGNVRLEMPRWGVGVPRERIVGPVAGKKIAGQDTQDSLLEERGTLGPEAQEAQSHHEVAGEIDGHEGDCCEVGAREKVTHLSFGTLSNYKVTNLIHKKVKAGGRVPRILVLRSRSVAMEQEPEPVQSPLSELLTVEEERAPRHVPVEELPAKHVVTVVPTPRKTRARIPKQEEEKAAPVTAPKPLKVIRRRREESPKVFETIPKSFPKAMLEGVDIDVELG
jgi:hypothetical protein